MSDNIKFIFTHSFLGHENFKKLFPDPLLHKKLHHIPAISFVNDFVMLHRRGKSSHFLNPLMNLRRKFEPHHLKHENINILVVKCKISKYNFIQNTKEFIVNINKR
jgi:hypothetical protein